MSNNRPPYVPKPLLDYLENLIPEKCVDRFQDVDEARFYAGKRAMVRLLRAWAEEQDDPLNPTQLL